MLRPMPDQKLDMLHSIPLFSKLRRSDLERLGQLADVVDVDTGRVLMREGDIGSQMFVIASGRVRVEKAGAMINDLGPGTWVGEIALLSEGPRTATVTVSEPSRLFVVSHSDFHSLMDELPSVRAAVLDSVAERLRRSETDSAH